MYVISCCLLMPDNTIFHCCYSQHDWYRNEVSQMRNIRTTVSQAVTTWHDISTSAQAGNATSNKQCNCDKNINWYRALMHYIRTSSITRYTWESTVAHHMTKVARSSFKSSVQVDYNRERYVYVRSSKLAPLLHCCNYCYTLSKACAHCL